MLYKDNQKQEKQSIAETKRQAGNFVSFCCFKKFSKKISNRLIFALSHMRLVEGQMSILIQNNKFPPKSEPWQFHISSKRIPEFPSYASGGGYSVATWRAMDERHPWQEWLRITSCGLNAWSLLKLLFPFLWRWQQIPCGGASLSAGAAICMCCYLFRNVQVSVTKISGGGSNDWIVQV